MKKILIGFVALMMVGCATTGTHSYRTRFFGRTPVQEQLETHLEQTSKKIYDDVWDKEVDIQVKSVAGSERLNGYRGGYTISPRVRNLTTYYAVKDEPGKKWTYEEILELVRTSMESGSAK